MSDTIKAHSGGSEEAASQILKRFWRISGTDAEVRRKRLEMLRVALDTAERGGMVWAAKEYGHHKSGCYSERNFERECDCGLYALRGPRQEEET